MKWNKFTLETTVAAEDIVSSILMEAGVQGIEIKDSVPLTEAEKEQMFVDIMPVPENCGDNAYISFYLEPDADKDAVLNHLLQELEGYKGLVDIGTCRIEEEETKETDWVNNWKKYFKQFAVDDILIVPSWEQVKEEDKDKLVIHIDPGTAFGTGMHETTQLCIRQIKKHLKPGDEILDVGCGSGILSIAALKLGAGHAVLTDLDENAIRAVAENMEVNGIDQKLYNAAKGNVIDDPDFCRTVLPGKFDLIVANILADVLIPLTPVVSDYVKPGGYYITSGILKGREKDIEREIEAAGLELVETVFDNDWVSVTGKKKG